jgi:hypothetical protein
MEECMKEEKNKKEYPLLELLDKSSLEFISKISGKNYNQDPVGKIKIFRTKSSMGTFQFKLLMEKAPEGKLYGR